MPGRRTTKKLNVEKSWSEREIFHLGLVLGDSAARNLGREEAVKAIANLLKRQEEEIRRKLTEIGFFSNERKSAQVRESRPARANVGSTRTVGHD